MGINKIQFQKGLSMVEFRKITERRINVTQHWLLRAGLLGLFVRSAAMESVRLFV